MALSNAPPADSSLCDASRWQNLSELTHYAGSATARFRVVLDPAVAPVLLIQGDACLSTAALNVMARAAMEDFLGSDSEQFEIAFRRTRSPRGGGAPTVAVSAVPSVLLTQLQRQAKQQRLYLASIEPMMSVAYTIAAASTVWSGSGWIVASGIESVAGIRFAAGIPERLTPPEFIKDIASAGDYASQYAAGDKAAIDNGPTVVVCFPRPEEATFPTWFRTAESTRPYRVYTTLHVMDRSERTLAPDERMPGTVSNASAA